MTDDDRLARIEHRLDEFERKMDQVLTFMNECSGGRKVFVAALKGAGVIAAALTALFAALKLDLKP